MGAAATFIIGDAFLNKGEATASIQNAVGKGVKSTVNSSVSPAPLLADAANENEAQKAAERRRRMYAGIGRSSTILTGPGGLGSLGDSNQAPKQLLGI